MKITETQSTETTEEDGIKGKPLKKLHEKLKQRGLSAKLSIMLNKNYVDKWGEG